MIKLPAGQYYIGDLCYVLSDEEWTEANSLMDYDAPIQQITLKSGRVLVLAGTAHGDGGYKDDCGRTYSVDSGTIGVTLADGLDCNNHGHIQTFDGDFSCDSYCGFIQFGGVSIDTDPDDDWDDDDLDDWDDLDYDDDELDDLWEDEEE